MIESIGCLFRRNFIFALKIQKNILLANSFRFYQSFSLAMVLSKVGTKTFTLAEMNAIFGVIILLPSWELKQQNP